MKKTLLLFMITFSIVITLDGWCSAPQTPALVNKELWYDTDGNPINAHSVGIIFHEGTYYWYGEHKVPNDSLHTSQVGVHCYSSKNLKDWKNEGIALAVSEDPQSPITRSCKLERTKVIYNKKTDKFVIWFHLNLKGNNFKDALAGVAVSDSAIGPFKFVEAKRLNAGKQALNVSDYNKRTDNIPEATRVFTGGDFMDGFVIDMGPNGNIYGRDIKNGQMSRDNNLFVDDDDTAYFITASEENATIHIHRLTDDYLDVNGEFIRIFAGKFFEAPTMFKRNNKYYLLGSHCTGWLPNAAQLAVADSIFEEWTYLGNPCVDEGSEETFGCQTSSVLKIHGKEDCYVALLDCWWPYTGRDANDSRYAFLPIKFDGDRVIIEWSETWAGLPIAK